MPVSALPATCREDGEANKMEERDRRTAHESARRKDHRLQRELDELEEERADSGGAPELSAVLVRGSVIASSAVNSLPQLPSAVPLLTWSES